MSNIGPGILKGATQDAIIYTLAECYFNLAEARQRGFITSGDDAKTLYNKGIQASFDYLGVAEDRFDIYTAQNKNLVNWDASSNKLEAIITQKWIANTINGYEGWIEYNRTGFPDLKTISASLNNNIIPVRMPYPAEEEALNSENYKKAAAATDGNSINTRVWWNN